MADKTQVEVQLIKNEEPVPPLDELIAGNKGAVYIDIIKISTAGTFKRGTLLMLGKEDYVPSTQAGIATAAGVCIICDDVTIGDNEFIETPAYFGGDFNDARVILPYETEADNHDALIEAIREPLRAKKIFLRKIHD